jgi:peptide/nickel transport system substrate-binding protein
MIHVTENVIETPRVGKRRCVATSLRSALGVALLLGIGAVIAGCGASGGSGTGQGASGGTLRIAIPTAEIFDPAKSSGSGASFTVQMDLVYAPLIHESPTGRYEPALATSWHYVKGNAEPNTIFDLTLRKGAKFSDGTPVTAKAVVGWLDYFTSAGGPFGESFGKDPKFEAVNEDTVRIVVASSNPSLPYLLSDAGPNAGFVVSPKGLEDPGKLKTEPQGAGPYVLDRSKTVQESTYVLTKNPDYFAADSVPFQKAELKILAEGTSRLQAQQSGQVDVATGETNTISAAEGAGLEVVEAPSSVPFFQFDLLHDPPAPIKDIRVRRAINLAIDREAIAKGIYDNSATPTSSLIPSDVDASKLEGYWEYNPKKAKEELAAAGYAGGFTLHTLTEGAYAGTPGEPLAQAVAKNLEEVGIKLEIETSPNAAEFGEAIFKYEYPFLKLSFGPAPTPVIYGTILAPEAPANFQGDDATIDKFYEEGSRAEDPEPAFLKMWERYLSQAYSAPIVAENEAWYVSDGVSGVAMSSRRPVVIPSEWAGE